MEHRFNAEEWKVLPAQERVRRCRLWAQEAQKLAEGTTPKVAETYLSIARAWLKLAGEIEQGGIGTGRQR